MNSTKTAKLIVDNTAATITLAIEDKTETHPLEYPWGHRVNGMQQILGMMGYKVELEFKQ